MYCLSKYRSFDYSFIKRSLCVCLSRKTPYTIMKSYTSLWSNAFSSLLLSETCTELPSIVTISGLLKNSVRAESAILGGLCGKYCCLIFCKLITMICYGTKHSHCYYNASCIAAVDATNYLESRASASPSFFRSCAWRCSDSVSSSIVFVTETCVYHKII